MVERRSERAMTPDDPARITRRNDMPAHSDSSSDPTPTRSIGSTGVGAHAATDAPAADAPTARYTPAEYTTVDRTPTSPAPSVAEPVATTATDTDRRADTDLRTDTDVDRHRGMGRGDRQQVVAAQKARYGGISWGAAFFGWLSANGMAVILIPLLSAGGRAFRPSRRAGWPSACPRRWPPRTRRPPRRRPGWGWARASRCWSCCSWPTWPAATWP